jgi:hypothetical protein
MARPPKLDDPQVEAAKLRIPERLLLFCVASATDWERAGITGCHGDQGVDRMRRCRRTQPHQAGRAVLTALPIAEDG